MSFLVQIGINLHSYTFQRLQWHLTHKLMQFGKPYADLSPIFFFFFFFGFFFWIYPKLHVITYKNWTPLSSITIIYHMP